MEPKVSKGRSESPLVAPAGAITPVTTMMKLFYCPTQLKFFIIHQSRQNIPIELHQPPHNLLHI